MAKVTIIGAGMMGAAMCWPLTDNGHAITLVGTPLDDEIIRSVRAKGYHPTLQRTLPPGVMPCDHTGLPQAAAGAELIVCGVSSFGVDWFAAAAGPHLRPGVPLLAVTKGMALAAAGRLVPLTDYLESRLPLHRRDQLSLNAIGGPCIAHELAARRQTCVVFAGRNLDDLQRLKGLCQAPYYHVFLSTGLLEVSLCAALKNGYALAVGIAAGMQECAGPDGLAQGYNPQAAVFAQSALEMRLLLRALGGSEEAIAGLPGAGDLFVTVFGGRTRRLGVLIGQGHPASEALEMLSGVTLESVEIITRTAQALNELAARGLIDLAQFPLLRFLDGVINRDQPPNFPWGAFFHA